MALETAQATNMPCSSSQSERVQIYCRLCLSDLTSSKYKQLFSPFTYFKSVAEMIGDLTHIEILENDSYSKLVCINCFDKLTATEDFKAVIVKSDSILRQQFPIKDPLETKPKGYIECKEEIEIVEHQVWSDDNEKSTSNKTGIFSQKNLVAKQNEFTKYKKTANKSDSRHEHYGTKSITVINFKCTFCNKRFLTNSQRRFHEISHKNARKYSCEKCGKILKNITSLESHKAVHLEAKLLKCDICNKLFKTQFTLRIHKKLHTEKSPCECEICHRQYNTEMQYKTHKRKYHNPSLIECDICGELVNNLTTHIKRHTKPYKCDICSQSFAQTSILKYHMTTHSDKTLYTCEICSKVFKHPSTYRNHVTSHTKKNRFQCELCTKAFHYKALLKRHMSRVHNFIKFT